MHAFYLGQIPIVQQQTSVQSCLLHNVTCVQLTSIPKCMRHTQVYCLPDLLYTTRSSSKSVNSSLTLGSNSSKTILYQLLGVQARSRMRIESLYQFLPIGRCVVAQLLRLHAQRSGANAAWRARRIRLLSLARHASQNIMSTVQSKRSSE